MQGPLAQLCFNHISCSKKYGFVAEGHPGRKSQTGPSSQAAARRM
jgi:hypothetical protein